MFRFQHILCISLPKPAISASQDARLGWCSANKVKLTEYYKYDKNSSFTNTTVPNKFKISAKMGPKYLKNCVEEEEGIS